MTDEHLPDLPDNYLEPFDPNYKPVKTLQQLAAEYPDNPGLQQQAQAELTAELRMAKAKGGVH
jgi:hypothetical protein